VTAAGVAIPSEELTTGRQGHYAGAASRLVAFVIDVGASWGLYTLGAAALVFVVNLLTGYKIQVSHYPIVASLMLAGWEFVYFAYQWTLSGKTIGMTILGVRVVCRDGSPVNGRRAALRTVMFPLGFLTLGLGFLGILVGRERRALYDRIAGTTVVYDWDARAARLRWLAHQGPGQPPVPDPAAPVAPPAAVQSPPSR
jgi:uncharacterized RDD family membrane protein YckC